MGLMPAAGGREIASGPRQPVVYHGGTVMHGVHVHTLFWAPPGHAFTGSPRPGVAGYEDQQQAFYAAAAHDSGTVGNSLSVLDQYGDGLGAGQYALTYSAATDSVNDTSPLPPLSRQCSSPAGLTACLTDLQLERELDRTIAARGAPRGLHDLWVIYTPPGVDVCLQQGACGTSSFSGYHSLFDLGHGTTIYAVVADPLIEANPPQGNDPEGSPESDMAADVAAHELVEAVTDPEGTGWLDSSGGEVGDKCNTAFGSPLGFASNGSPYNQRLDGRPYQFQEMWSNVASGCVQSAGPDAPPALATIDLRQFSATVSGTSGRPRAGVAVRVTLLKNGNPFAVAGARTDRHGAWRAVLRAGGAGAPAPVGDDRDTIVVRYGAGGPRTATIDTGNGGNPFTQQGFTGWTGLDYGFAVARHSVSLAPCGQTGVLSLRVGGVSSPSPVDLCQAESDVSVVPTAPIGPGTPITFTSTDNRASTPLDPPGEIVRLSIALGEPGAAADGSGGAEHLSPTGFPTCTADLRRQRVGCDGLVPGAPYTLTRWRAHAVLRARAGQGGHAAFPAFAAGSTPALAGGDRVSLRNRAGRVLTTLHVGHLRVDLSGASDTVASGRCEPGAYWGPPAGAGNSQFVILGGLLGVGPAGGGSPAPACGPDGDAAGFPSSALQESDAFSGGLTQTEVPTLGATAPSAGATLYGPFIAVGQASLGGRPVSARIAVVISRRGSRHVVRRLSGLERPQGVRAPALPRGVYTAVFTLSDANGDTRTVRSWFVEAR